jgi:hypothetical protein
MRHRVTAALAVGALPCLNNAPANAAEGGIGAYLMGSRSNGAGVGSTNIAASNSPSAWSAIITSNSRPIPARAAGLGSFEGRVVALGGAIGYTFEIGKLPVSTRLKVFREFDAVNHLEGTAGFFTVSLPLAIDASVSSATTGKAIKARF